MSDALAGRTVLVTRGSDSAAPLLEQLESCGAKAIAVQVLEVLPPRDEAPLRHAIEHLGDYSWIVFTSFRAIQSFPLPFAAQGPGNKRALKVAVVGPRTAQAARDAGLAVGLQARANDAASLIEDLLEVVGPQERVLYLRAEQISQELAAPLRERGAVVDEVVAYRTGVCSSGVGEAAALLGARTVDWLTAHSGSALQNLVAHLPEPQLLWRVRLATIGPSTSRAARDLGLTVHAQAAGPEDSALVAAIVARENAPGKGE